MALPRVLAMTLAVAAIWQLSAQPVTAKYPQPQLEQVPIAKLIANLENLVAKDPKDVKVRFNLARAHAMAWASKVETVSIWTGKEAQGVWFGYEHKFVPFVPKKSDDDAANKLARAHLARAIERYEETIKLDGNLLEARLGYAWCLEQARNKADAIREYRSLLRDAWKKEQDLKNLGKGGKTITVEAVGYLIPLLDREKDKQEIEELESRVAKLKKLPRSTTPIVVPLRSGLTAHDMVNLQARVRFDADGSGLTEEWTWFTRNAGVLVYDRHGKGQITSALQWFGNVTFWMFWDNGYEALRALDDNGDGVLTGNELTGLALWVDANGNGVSDPGEVKTLAEWGIVALSCRWEIDAAHPDQIAWSKAGATFRDGTTRPTFDVILRKW